MPDAERDLADVDVLQREPVEHARELPCPLQPPNPSTRLTRVARAITLPAIAASAPAGIDPGHDASPWAPLRASVFRALWLASLAGFTGSWFQTVGAQWLLVGRPHASLLVALVQTANALPYVVFGLVAGVLADTLDRSRLLIAVEAAIAAVGGLLAALTFAGQVPSTVLLLLLFLLGSGAVLATPVY